MQCSSCSNCSNFFSCSVPIAPVIPCSVPVVPCSVPVFQSFYIVVPVFQSFHAVFHSVFQYSSVTVVSCTVPVTSSHVKNSRHFTEMMGSVHVESGEILVSFDVSSLFTNVPVDEAISVICGRLREDETLGDRTILSPEQIAELLEMCLKSTYFSYGGSSYEQKEGVAMGSPVSAVVANLYMEFFEELALETALTRHRLWKRYVDDTFCILRKGSTEEVLHHLNGVKPTIKFTVEQVEDGTLPFLNTLLRRRKDVSLDVSIYRKPTDTD